MIRPSANRLAWLLIRDEIARQPAEARLAWLLMDECRPVAAAASLVRHFGDAIKRHDLATLTEWTSAATGVDVEQDIRNFATGIQRDWREVATSLTNLQPSVPKTKQQELIPCGFSPYSFHILHRLPRFARE